MLQGDRFWRGKGKIFHLSAHDPALSPFLAANVLSQAPQEGEKGGPPVGLPKDSLWTFWTRHL